MEASTSSSPATSKEEALREQERPEAEYINSKCVLFTYLNGDINALVDQHFSRALSNYNPDARSTRGRKGSTASSGSLNDRSFPASFWDSDYQAPTTTCTASGSCIGSPHTELQLTPTDPYPAALHPHLAQPPDHWHFPLAGHLSPQSPAYHQARTIHELYPVGPNLDPRYSSLLVPALRANRLQPTLSAQEPSSPWSGVFPTAEVTQTLNLNVDAARHYCIPRGSFFS
ncbi:transcription cofactor vestigial-like protein 2 isoform X2 [Amblyraja radiata]|uniref:transcription cofactor vestigial-like protein 2 isoform X2 n=1 Tax=Amblyraja radiata TaxID=386614 RepID=UPI001401FC93|nr:transcription cofactor vestigial-like protein 2 isoform X2 [Amblyraja radiata]